MMRMKPLVGALVLGLTLAGALGARADQPTSSPDRHARREQRFQQWLGLSDDQMQQIRTLRANDGGAGKQLAQTLAAAQKELRQLALNGADAATLGAKAAEVQQLLGQVVQLRVKHLQEIAPILTPEQRQKLAESPGPGPGHWRGHRGTGPSS
jgi:Spy/CpxP family protein refolding chaperone